MHYLNLATYKFIDIPADTLPDLQQQLQQQLSELEIKGTVLLSSEGINIFVAGSPTAIHTFVSALNQHTLFADMDCKYSQSSQIPFKRLRVMIKKEIITLKQPRVKPQRHTAPYIEPQQLKQWYAEKKDILVLDARNHYEVAVGTFENAQHLAIENFSDFPKAIAALPEDAKHKPVVTFCTGGIRCEKAAEYLQQQGFQQVLQLRGGILNYFAQCGGEYFNGDCFVFDERGAVDAQLAATNKPHKGVK